ncbi:FecR family protein [Parapedobacter sp. 10938]|uniref:FecR family protein n=1 Tax=Parapedobacter flavus TaxID=3110225 RepID=UPI002DBCEA9D|nr:FecR domain-containing protein [Parapedobacter sp. 10938]MEC3880512.1 FecR domain-containing protein [Parapedobacter sp. 10938]
MTKREAVALLRKYAQGQCTEEERMLIEAWYDEQVVQRGRQPSGTDYSQHYAQSYKAIINHRRKPKLAIYRFIPYAAAVALISFAVIWWYHDARIDKTRTQQESAEIQPGRHRATLTLADGRQIDLSSDHQGIVMEDSICYADGSVVTVEPGTSEITTAPETSNYVLSTPKGGTYQLILPDGSKVWLNAASKLTYPANFSASNRTVSLAGEAFFHVKPMRAENASGRSPFRVMSRGQEIVVLGTKFNVSAHLDEDEVVTTLVDGKVRLGLEARAKRYILRPGEQAKMMGGGYSIAKVDVSEFIDWKDGYFTFNKTPIKKALANIARWYDVEIVYHGNLDGLYFGGSLSRQNSLQSTLDILSTTAAMKFKINERRVIVMP